MVIEDALVITGCGVLVSAIAAMWVYYNRRLSKFESRLSQVEKLRIDDYKEHLETSRKLTERCVAAIERFTTAINTLIRKKESHVGLSEP
jgi:hypothetical protein